MGCRFLSVLCFVFSVLFGVCCSTYTTYFYIFMGLVSAVFTACSSSCVLCLLEEGIFEDKTGGE